MWKGCGESQGMRKRPEGWQVMHITAGAPTGDGSGWSGQRACEPNVPVLGAKR